MTKPQLVSAIEKAYDFESAVSMPVRTSATARTTGSSICSRAASRCFSTVTVLPHGSGPAALTALDYRRLMLDVRGVRNVNSHYDGTVTYHDSCSGLRERREGYCQG